MTKIIEITNCQDCFFIQPCNDKGKDGCFLDENIFETDWEGLSYNKVHDSCPLKKDSITIQLKQTTKPTLADLDHRDVLGYPLFRNV